jgi:short-subunit dehydrogenase
MRTMGCRALVIGASSGIGAALARVLAGRGSQVAIVARRQAELERLAAELNTVAGRDLVKPYVADVTNYDAVPAIFDQIVRDLGGVDLVIYAAGVMPRQTPEEYSFDKDRAVVETNFLAAIAWLNPAAEMLGKQGSGAIVGISSIAADRGRRGYPVYNASKAGLATYLEGLRNRVGRFGVQVVTSKPGYVQTAMLEGVQTPVPPISAEDAARQILNAVETGINVHYVPEKWRLISMIVNAIPSPIFQKLKI